MNRFITIKDDYKSVDIIPSNVGFMSKSSTELHLSKDTIITSYHINITCMGGLELSFRKEEDRDEAYKEIKDLISEITS